MCVRVDFYAMYVQFDQHYVLMWNMAIYRYTNLENTDSGNNRHFEYIYTISI